jgi:hypothetical protein
MGKVLHAEEFIRAMQRIADWRANPGRPVACPVCNEVCLIIEDQSARPHAEWYHLTCPACELDTNVHIPLAGR